MNAETLSAIVKILMVLDIGTAIGVLLFGIIFAVVCLLGPDLDDAMRDRR